MNEHSKALRHCRTALKLDPQNIKALHLMGNILQELGQEEDAQDYFLRAEAIAQQSLVSETEAPTTSTAAEPSSSSSASSSTHAKSVLGHLTLLNMSVGESRSVSDGERTFQITCLSQRPYLYYVPDLLSAADCESIQSRGEPLLEKSFLMGGKTAYDSTSEDRSLNTENKSDLRPDSRSAYRSSYSCWLPPNAAARALQSRIALLTGLPLPYVLQRSEDLQVVKYSRGGQFNVHHDSSAFHPRLMTALVYLNDINSDSTMSDRIHNGDNGKGSVGSEQVCDGGSDVDNDLSSGGTWFPFATPPSKTQLGESTSSNSDSDNTRKAPNASLLPVSSVEAAIEQALSARASREVIGIGSGGSRSSTDTGSSGKSVLPGLVVRPRRGAGILFFNHDPYSGALDPSAVHAGLPVGAPVDVGQANSDSIMSDGKLSTSAGERTKWIANYWIQWDPKAIF